MMEICIRAGHTDISYSFLGVCPLRNEDECSHNELQTNQQFVHLIIPKVKNLV